ncbi:MAG TPA: N,N-dimethylformamidase beta subunit family domain-containing protein, partial [Solirubrobacterales bacterium]|nr:N,N-dimethylformamidase beta subunit family domain-containing protein [Solirubrobacterales bacterium]
MLLGFAVAVLSGLALLPATAMAGPCDPPNNEIVCENSKAGNPASEWDVGGEGDSSIQGFATDISVDRGETIQFKVDTNSTKYRFDIYRMGYYGGDGARKVATVAGTPHSQPACDEEASTGLIDCGNWAVSASWAVPSSAVSGIYFAHLEREDKSSEGSQIVFVVRDDESESELLFQTSDTTWEAYNEYGGNSFYTGDPGEDPGRAYKVSYNRPLTTRGSGAQDAPFNAEYPMVRWLERNGYDVSYFTGVDADRRGGEILEHDAYLSVGHDEYWSGTQRANVEAAREAGVSLAFFSGNEVFWKTRWEDSIDGSSTDHRTLVCYKETHANEPIDPEDPSVWTGTWRDPRFSPPADGGRPENELTGTIFAVNVGTTAIEVPAKFASLRLWRNTDIAELEPGETATLGEDTLGYEWDEDAENGFRPAGLLPLSSTSDEVPQRLVDYGSTYSTGTATHHLTLYRSASGALVFGAGTVQWSWGLDDEHDRGEAPVDSRMQQATVNLFADMGVQPGTLQARLATAAESTDTTPPTTAIAKPAGEIEVQSGQPYTIEGTAVDSEGEGQGGGVIGAVEVSVDSGETWHLADGAESWSYTWTPEELGATTILARATDDSANLGTSAEVDVEVTAQACPCSIWDESSEAPQDSDSSAIELGVKFRTEVTGYVSGIRFYKTSGNTGTHVGRLWTPSGEQLAQVTFTGESGSGWQQADFDTPVEIKANTTYVASYYAPFGHYASIEDYFALVGYDNPPLHALADGADGANGIYAYGSSGGLFSNGGPNTFHSENYLVDVSFEKKLVPDTTPPTIGSRTPVDGATEVATDVSASASFDEAMDPATIDGSTAELRDSLGTLIPATVSYDAGQRKVTIDPDEALDYSTAYTATIEGGSEGVADLAGNRLAADSSWTFSTAAPPPAPPDEGPGGPILVIANSGNSFSRYYDEILRAEGLNEFTATDITNVTPSLLAGYDAAILGDGPLSVTQAQTLTNWVEAGGNLVAMRPDAKLAGLLGISSAGGTLGNAYLKVDTSTAPGAGIVGDTIQFHGTADRYTTAGAQTVATLYSDASTSTSNPAVTLREVGENGGHAAAFTYDLAKSVVYTRQGNPAWNEDERDGISPVRSDDFFYGAKEGDEQPDWVDSEKIEIPQADEQQRLLTNLVEQMNVDRKPLPRFWFLPDDHKAAVVMTGDDHANNGTTGRFEHFESLDSPGCVVAEWQCVRSTSYIYPNTPISDAKAAGFVANGFEIALHTTNGCRNWDDQEDLEGTYSGLLAEFAADFPSLPAPTTNRMHCIVWSDWASQPKVELKDGIRLDTTYYYWPAKWVQNRPGLFTGSGMPMRFADLDGSLIDVYQAATQLTDESEQTYPFNAEVLLDNALGSQGYYGTFVANMHTDKVESPEADAIVAVAQARGVPVISARQLLTWLDGRNQSSFGSIEWSGNHLSFTISPAAGADGLRAMVPVESAIGALQAVKREGTPVATTTRTIKGVEYAFFDATAGDYTASYIDEQTPEISNVQVQAENDGAATVTWDTSEPASSRVDYGASSGSLPFSQSDPEPVTSHSVQISGLEPNATYYFRVTSADEEANSVTEPEMLLSPATFATLPEAPVLSATVPPSPANQNSPKIVGSAGAGTTVDLFAGGDCSGSPVAGGTAAELEAGIEVAVGDDSSTEFRATATGGGGASNCSAPLAYLEDSTPPEAQIEASPPTLANSDSASFSFAGEDPGGSGLAAIECRIDSADPEAWSACNSPQAYTELADGSHRFEVRAIDNAGNADQSPAVHEWTVDTTPPALSIDSGPEGLTVDPTPTFAFSSEPGATIECSIDGGAPAFGACSGAGAHTPASPLADGSYTFRVRATDAAGNQVVRTREFEVDATAPTTQIDLAPAALDNSATASFEFSGEDPGGSGVASYQCKLDGASFAACSSGIELTELAEGAHKFEVRAIDNAGNVDGSPAIHEWTVDSQAPSTQVDSQPPAFDNNATANFAFSGEDPGGSGVASYQCRRDSADPEDWQPCVSPLKYTSLAQGPHTFEVRAIDKAGNVDGAPATYGWTIDTKAPETQIDLGPAALVSSSEASFELSGADPEGSGVALYQCRRDSEDPEAWSACTSPLSYTELADGSHKFEVRAVDQAGNADGSPASYEWTVDTTPPALSIDSGPEGLTVDPTPTFTFAYSPASGDTLECSIDTGEAAYGPCSGANSHSPAEALANGPHTFRVRAGDEAGNESVATREFEVDATAPDTQIAQKPAALVATAEATFGFTGDDAEGSGIASYQCRRDSEDPEAWSACTSPLTYTELAEGAHKFEVRAIDNAGNVDQTPAGYEWSVDTVAPQTQIDVKPATLDNSDEPTFEFSGSDPEGSGVSSYQCRRDSADPEAWAGCPSPRTYAELAEGAHKFEVRAIDNAGNVDQSAASYEWTIDSVPPETQIDLAPPAIANSAKASFEFSGEDPGGSGVASYQCRRDSDEPIGWQFCGSPLVYTSLAEGAHKFEVRAIDNAGSPDPSPGTFEWTIDTKAPQTQITGKPAALVDGTTATFEFSGEDVLEGSGVASFECKLDATSFTTCATGVEYTELSEGAHKFEVRTIDQAGNADGTPAAYEWQIDLTPPAVSVDSGSEDLTNDNTPTFGFGSEPGASFECSIDAGTPAFEPCSGAESHTPAEP